MSTGRSTLQDLSTSSPGSSTSLNIYIYTSEKLNIDMELNIDCDEGVPLVPSGGYRAVDDGRSVPFGTPERVGHRGVNQTIESDGNTSDASLASEPNLTDSSSDDEGAVQGVRVKRLVKGFEKMRRVRRKPLH